MEHDWDSFYEECYRVSYAKNGEKTLFYKYFKDYQSIEDVKKDFEFFGAIDNIQLVPYKKGDFPEALMEMSYIGTNQLKFTVTDRADSFGHPDEAEYSYLWRTCQSTG